MGATSRAHAEVPGVLAALGTALVRSTELFVPRQCPCGRPGPVPCRDCAALLQAGPVRVESVCPSLGMVVDADARTGRVGTAARLPVLALGRHVGPLRDLVLAYKDGGELSLARAFGDALRTGLAHLELTEMPVLVPVPSALAHRVRRGEDHTRLLAQHIARGTCLAVHPTPMLRGPGQQGRGRRERRARADPARMRVRQVRDLPRTAVLVDDVATTGATLRALADALEEVGCSAVGALVVAAARLPEDGGRTGDRGGAEDGGRADGPVPRHL